MQNEKKSFKETLAEVNSACNSVFYSGIKDIKEKTLECATNIYIAQMKEVEEARHGEWETKAFENPHCSLCGKYNINGKTKYCPHCGGIMDRKKNDNG